MSVEARTDAWGLVDARASWHTSASMHVPWLRPLRETPEWNLWAAVVRLAFEDARSLRTTERQQALDDLAGDGLLRQSQHQQRAVHAVAGQVADARAG